MEFVCYIRGGESFMGLIVIIVFIAFAIRMLYVQSEHYKEEIYRQIEQLGGQVINIERQTLSTRPFSIAGKEVAVYKIKYKIDGEVEEGWVRFGGIFGPSWKL
jgi:c-di-AMP phosphodiesterase-like protein